MLYGIQSYLNLFLCLFFSPFKHIYQCFHWRYTSYCLLQQYNINAFPTFICQLFHIMANTQNLMHFKHRHGNLKYLFSSIFFFLKKSIFLCNIHEQAFQLVAQLQFIIHQVHFPRNIMKYY
jgi:hypothetical protein